uniref:Uncharacterized protein n=1 Tax=viral metagenome TaxID=1070528 RepID=A0A6M3ITQ7_9ZZZZ
MKPIPIQSCVDKNCEPENWLIIGESESGRYQCTKCDKKTNLILRRKDYVTK